MDEPVRWGVLGAAGIALSKVIPGMRACRHARIDAIASRDLTRARDAADALDIRHAYGSYDELLDDPDIDVIYNALPNHLHVPWSARALDAGKHVLCEKPIAMSAAEARELRTVRDRTGLQVGEAFMVRVHPQWLAVHEHVRAGRVGELRLITCQFSYTKRDADNIRNIPEYGGGALMDIGCYPIHLSRWLFGSEPVAVLALMDRDPDMGIDRLTSAVLRFETGQSTFSCATQLVPHQRMQLFGTMGRIEVEVPFNAPATERCRIFLDDGRDVQGRSTDVIEFPIVDQYALQADAFSDAVLGRGAVPVPLEDAIANMAVIDALFRSAERGEWERIHRS